MFSMFNVFNVSIPNVKCVLIKKGTRKNVGKFDFQKRTLFSDMSLPKSSICISQLAISLFPFQLVKLSAS